MKKMGLASHSFNRRAGEGGCPYDVLVPYLSYLGRMTAKQVGVQPVDLDTCERTFVESMIVLNERKLRHLIASGSFGWIRTCARDHALTFRRSFRSSMRRTLPDNSHHGRRSAGRDE